MRINENLKLGMLRIVSRSNICRQSYCNFIYIKNLKRAMASLDSPNKVMVRVDEGSIQLSFKYGCKHMPERQFNFKRLPEEELRRLFLRISSNISAVLSKKNKKKKKGESQKQSDIPEVNVSLTVNNVTLDGEIKNIDAWKDGAILQVGDSVYEVNINAPTVKSISLPTNIMAGFHVYPKLELEFTNRDECEFIWYKNLTKEEKSTMKNDSEDCKSVVRTKSDTWLEVGRGFYFMTSVQDVGRRLRILCKPKCGIKSGFEADAESCTTIGAGPGPCPFEERHLYTKNLTESGSIRCISYNILADLYADSEFSRTVLYPYCPPYALELDYRKQIIIKEILGYNGDIICLQEVDSKVYSADLLPLFGTSGFDGIFSLKGGQVAEGLACFYRTSKFRLLNSQAIILSEAVQTNPLFVDILAKISENEKLKERMLSRTTALQIVLLEAVEKVGHKVLAANTHLYFHPEGDNIRLLQAGMCLRYVEHVLECYKCEDPSSSIAVLFCGDFNSTPEYAVYQLTTTGHVPEDSEAWKSKDEEIVEGMPFAHRLSLASACGTPPYTNYTSSFYGCLDYIFFDTQLLDVAEVVPLPSHEQVTQHTALPSITFPSDHMALVSTLRWR